MNHAVIRCAPPLSPASMPARRSSDVARSRVAARVRGRLLGPDATDRIPFSLGGNAGRLRKIKSRCDPYGVFTAIPLPG